MEKGRRSTVPAVSAVCNRQYKNIFVGLPKSLSMSKSKSLAKRLKQMKGGCNLISFTPFD